MYFSNPTEKNTVITWLSLIFLRSAQKVYFLIFLFKRSIIIAHLNTFVREVLFLLT